MERGAGMTANTKVRARSSIMNRVPIVLVLSVVLVALGAATSDAATATAGVSARENVSFFYQQVTSTTNLSRLGHVKLVVAGIQANDPVAAARIKATGAKAYRYVQSYWFPKGETYDGMDIGAHPDWAFCATGGTPLVGRTTGAGAVWWLLDMNERPVQHFF